MFGGKLLTHHASDSSWVLHPLFHLSGSRRGQRQPGCHDNSISTQQHHRPPSFPWLSTLIIFIASRLHSHTFAHLSLPVQPADVEQLEVWSVAFSELKKKEGVAFFLLYISSAWANTGILSDGDFLFLFFFFVTDFSISKLKEMKQSVPETDISKCPTLDWNTWSLKKCVDSNKILHKWSMTQQLDTCPLLFFSWL